jgi:hypothetical protein
VTSEGGLISCTLQPEHEVLAWVPHSTKGFVEAVNVIPSPDGKRDDVWIVVRRTIAGNERRFVEYFDAGDQRGRAQADLYYVDAGLSYVGASDNGVGGASHLAGETVDVLVNGAAHPAVVVGSDGRIPIQKPPTSTMTVHIGFGYLSYVLPMPIDAGAVRGTAQGQTKRISHVGARVHRTMGGKIGPSLDKLTALKWRKGSDPLGQAIELYSGLIEPVAFDGPYEREGDIYFVQDQPLPLTLCSLLPRLTTHDTD